jgi:hypothetical protein
VGYNIAIRITNNNNYYLMLDEHVLSLH